MHSKKYRALSNDDLVTRLRELDAVERSTTVDYIFVLAEMARRDQHLALGYSNLFAYCFHGRGLEKSYAYRRSAAAEIVNKFPLAGEMLADGRLSISTLVPFRRVLTSANHREVLERAVGLSEVKVIRLVATLDPRRVPATVIRTAAARVVDRREFGFSFGTETTAATPAELLPPTSAAPAPIARVASPAVEADVALVPPPPPRVERLTAKYTRIHLSVDDELLSLLDQARSAFSHVVPSGDVPEVLRQALKLALDAVARRRLGARADAVSAPKRFSVEGPDGSASAPDPSPVEGSDESGSAPKRTSAVPTDESVSAPKRFSAERNEESGSAPKQISVDSPRRSSSGRDSDGSTSKCAASAMLDSTASSTTGVPAESVRSGDAEVVSVPKQIELLVGGPPSRGLSVGVRSFVWKRDDGRCVFEGSGGHRCGSTWRLEFAHIVAFAKGGRPTADNIRLLCGAHNHYEAKLEFPEQVARHTSSTEE